LIVRRITRAQRVRLACANVDDDRAGKKAPVHQDGNARRWHQAA
jgi:hypothetical protein